MNHQKPKTKTKKQKYFSTIKDCIGYACSPFSITMLLCRHLNKGTHMPTGFIGKLASAIFYGIIVFLVVLAMGLLIIHFVTAPEGTSYGNTVKGLAVLLGVLAAVAAFFGNWTWPRHPQA